MSTEHVASIDVLSINSDSTYSDVYSLLPYAEKVEMIPLGTELDPFVIPKKVLIEENGGFLVLSSGQVYEYTKDGVFNGRFSPPYDGEGRYFYINDICLNSDMDKVMCLTQHNHIVMFDIYTKSLLKDVDSNIHGMTGCAIVPMEKDGFSILFLAPQQESCFDARFDCMKMFNKRGKLLEASLPRTDFYLSFAQYSPVVQGYDNAYYITYSTSPGPSYICQNGIIGQWLDISSEKKGIPEHYLIEDCNNPWDKLETLMVSDYYKCPFSVCRTKDNVFFEVYGPEGVVSNFLYSESSHKGIKWETRGNAQPVMNVLAADENFLYFTLYEPDYVSSPDKYDSLKDLIYKKTGYVYTKDSVSALFKIEFVL